MKNRQSNGFTLLEIMVVLFLVSIIALIIVPKLSFKNTNDLQETTRRIVREIKILQWESISRQRLVRLEFDLDQKQISASMLAPSGTLIPLKVLGTNKFTLSSKVAISKIQVLHEGKVQDGKTFTQFFSSGAIEPTTIYLRDFHEHRMVIVVHPLTGRILVFKGDYRSVKAPSFYGPPSGEIPSFDDSTH